MSGEPLWFSRGPLQSTIHLQYVRRGLFREFMWGGGVDKIDDHASFYWSPIESCFLCTEKLLTKIGLFKNPFSFFTFGLFLSLREGLFNGEGASGHDSICPLPKQFSCSYLKRRIIILCFNNIHIFVLKNTAQQGIDEEKKKLHVKYCLSVWSTGNGFTLTG